VSDERLASLLELTRERTIVALTGAGCSTESGIPCYRGAFAPPRARPPMQHADFVRRAEARRRYWARSLVGWSRIAGARPNPAHDALAALERAGVLAGVITQNVDGLHHAAGSQRVVELHGRLARVRCLACDLRVDRAEHQERLLAANPDWSGQVTLLPDGDAEISDELEARFQVPDCACGGVMMPDVVFFGGSVPRPTLDDAWALFERAEVLLVVGSSLTVFSGFRFVRRAAERGLPVAIVNRGETRGDSLAALRVDASAAAILPALAQNLSAVTLVGARGAD